MYDNILCLQFREHTPSYHAYTLRDMERHSRDYCALFFFSLLHSVSLCFILLIHIPLVTILALTTYAKERSISIIISSQLLFLFHPNALVCLLWFHRQWGSWRFLTLYFTCSAVRIYNMNYFSNNIPHLPCTCHDHNPYSLYAEK